MKEAEGQGHFRRALEHKDILETIQIITNKCVFLSSNIKHKQK